MKDKITNTIFSVPTSQLLENTSGYVSVTSTGEINTDNGTQYSLEIKSVCNWEAGQYKEVFYSTCYYQFRKNSNWVFSSYYLFQLHFPKWKVIMKGP